MPQREIGNLQQLHGVSTAIMVDRFPDRCPRRHVSVAPNRLNGYVQTDQARAYVPFICPNEACDSIFVVQYRKQDAPARGYVFETAFPQDPAPEVFSETVQDLSPDFVDIYGQAYKAELFGLSDICGAGYRKALEFLVKDYLIKKKGIPKHEVAPAMIGTCIRDPDWITDARLRQAAERAAWLGNDEIHYERWHPGLTVDDLKTLIRLTVHWIEGEMLTEAMVARIPEKRGKIM